MAQSFAGNPDIIRFQLGAGDVLTRLDFPNATRKVTVFFETNAGKVATTGSDGQAIGAAFASVDADSYWSMCVDQDADERGRGPASIYLASAVGSTWVVAIATAGC